MKARFDTLRGRGAILLALLVACFCALPGVAGADFGTRSYTGALQVVESPPEAPGVPGKPGTPLLQAGAHPDLAVDAQFNSYRYISPFEGTEGTELETPEGNLKNFLGYGPPGLLGDPTNVPTCQRRELQETGCSPDSQIGILYVTSYGGGERSQEPVPLYNLERPPGLPAEFGGNLLNTLIFVDAKVVNRDGVYSLALFTRNVSEAITVGGFRLALWGVPAASSHDAVRANGNGNEPFGQVKSTAPKLPFLSNPTSCSGTPVVFDGAVATSYQGNTAFPAPFSSDEFGRPLIIDGCDKVPFDASLRARPTTEAADSPSGLDVTVTIPQTELATGPSTSHLRDAVVTFPEGMTINPAAANGLESCPAAAANLNVEAPASCPAGSKLGTVSIETPVVDHPLEGEVFLARQRDNKFGSLIGLYVTVADPGSGIVLKLPAKIETSASGQITASFLENPQLPFETLELSLFGGRYAALRTPAACGTYTTTGDFTPWSGTATVRASDSFRITSGPGGGSCPNGGFDPSFTAGTTATLAGHDAPFVLQIGRGDGTQGLASLTATLPEGLLAKIAGIPYCPDAALASVPTADGTGAAQLASPSCPAASQIGKVSVNVGAGPNPFEVATGKAYLAGPYKGAPLSLAVVTPAVAGPFDLGNVVVRTALNVDSGTTQVTAISDPLPTVLQGIPLDLRTVSVNLDRPGFTLNPTSCEGAAVTAKIAGLGGAVADRSAPFRATECATLGFRPKLALSVAGATGRGGDPALTATLTPRGDDANASRVQVLLPKSAFIDQAHINNPCTRVQFDAGKCPASSVLGTAKAYTPLLYKPLEGPVYFRSNGGARQLPDIVADLGGQVHVAVVGFIDSKKSGSGSRVRATFATIPDAPVSRFVLSLKGGKRGLIENSADLCRGKQVATVRAVGQNEGVATYGTRIEALGCGDDNDKRKAGR